MEIIHPILHLEKEGTHKAIEPPNYGDISDNSIYMFITRYKSFLLYKELSPQHCSYNQKEQTMFILHTLKVDTRFKEDLIYVEATIQAYQWDTVITPTTLFPLDLEIDEITVTIDERSDAYTVGDKSAVSRVLNPYARMMVNLDTPSIQALGRRDANNKPPDKAGYKRYKDQQETNSKIRNTQICKACMGVGHCIKNQDTICYVVAKAHICNRFVTDDTNTQLVKSNNYRYEKEQKDKAIRNKISSRIDRYVKRIEDDGHSPLQMSPMIHMQILWLKNVPTKILVITRELVAVNKIYRYRR